MIRKKYENDKAMFVKMKMKEIDKFLLVNQLKQDKVHLKINLKTKEVNFNFNIRSYLLQDIKQFDLFVINVNVSHKVLSLNINFQ